MRCTGIYICCVPMLVLQSVTFDRGHTGMMGQWVHRIIIQIQLYRD